MGWLLDHGKGGWLFLTLTGIFGGVFFRDDDLIPPGRMGTKFYASTNANTQMPVYHDISVICHDITGNCISMELSISRSDHDQFFPAIPQGF